MPPRNGDPAYRGTVILAGMGRSGTTWLTDIINHAREYRVVWEPFLGSRVPEAECFEYHQYLRPDDRRREFIQGARAVLTGQATNGWTNSHGYSSGTALLIKDIRANLLLGWLRANFPGVKIVLLLRHPGAVSASWSRLGWGREAGGDRSVLEICLSQAELVEDHLKPFLPRLLEAVTDFERHVLLWCVLNYVPLRQFRPGEIHLAFYERFCEQPAEELDRLFAFLGTSHDERIERVLRRPSALAHKESAVRKGADLLESWRSHVTGAQIERAVDALRLFGLDALYGDGSVPLTDDPAAILGVDRDLRRRKSASQGA